MTEAVLSALEAAGKKVRGPIQAAALGGGGGERRKRVKEE